MGQHYKTLESCIKNFIIPSDNSGLGLVKASIELGGCEIHSLASGQRKPRNVLGPGKLT